MSKIIAVIDLGYVNIYMVENVNKPEEFGKLKVSMYDRSPTDKVYVRPHLFTKSPLYMVDVGRGVRRSRIVSYNVHKVYKRAHGKLEPVTEEVL